MGEHDDSFGFWNECDIGLASADVTAKRDAWKHIATGKTGSKQR